MTDYTVMTHPLIQHKISKLRDKNTGTAEFRALVEEIAMLMGYEALKDLPTEDVCIETPIEECMTPVIAGRNLAIVPILRAGLGMVSGLQALVPTAKIGHIGLYRDEETHEPHEYYCKLPDPIDERLIVVTDPMLATGGSAVAAVDFIKQHGGKHIKFMSIIAAPQGIERLLKAHPDIQLYVGHVDRELNENAYICPGLGDAGRQNLRNKVKSFRHAIYTSKDMPQPSTYIGLRHVFSSQHFHTSNIFIKNSFSISICRPFMLSYRDWRSFLWNHRRDIRKNREHWTLSRG